MGRSEQKEKRREEILSAGLNLFIRKGYAATKTLDISQAAGISEGLLFHYFETKEKLYEELIKLGISGPQGLLDNIKGDAFTFFQTAVREIFKYIETMPFVAKMFVLMKQAGCNDAAPESVKKLLAANKIFSSSIEKIKEGQKSGTIRDGDPTALAIAYWGAVQGIAEQAALFPDNPIPDSEWIVDILRRRN
ncbi:MAG: TetR/AcrR family transcriptional regulator [Treponema sp.]|nr:TetR/AcrR family transcriptional regulator [Treponema sp.]